MNSSFRVDILVFGGGIAGLWLLAYLRRLGYSALLVETGALGGIQTVASQGIIHGGTKYALSGSITASTREIGAMPAIWRDCLAGAGELDLTDVRVLSEQQYLWSTEGMVSRLAGFFAGRAMQSRVSTVSADGRPEVFRNSDFGGNLYRLDEPVLDVVSLVAELTKQIGDYCFRIEGIERLESGGGAALPGVEVRSPETGEFIRLQARCFVFAAGAGNEGLLRLLGWQVPAMQRRPLHMLMARGKLPKIFAHCIEAGVNPRLTITSHATVDDRTVWYIGGQIAETGIARTSREQIAAGQAELRAVLHWVDFSSAQWSTVEIDRAEPAQPAGRRPDSFFVAKKDRIIVAWPTKLAFAPRLAAEVANVLRRSDISPSNESGIRVPDLPHPPQALPPWEGAVEWK